MKILIPASSQPCRPARRRKSPFLRCILPVAPGRRPKVGSAIRSALLRKTLPKLVPPPSDWPKSGVRPSRTHCSAVPRASIVQNEYEPALVLPAKPLHDVQVVVHIQDLRVAAGILFMCAHEGCYPTPLPRETETPSVVILPKHAGITLLRQDESIGQHLVAD